MFESSSFLLIHVDSNVWLFIQISENKYLSFVLWCFVRMPFGTYDVTILKDLHPVIVNGKFV